MNSQAAASFRPLVLATAVFAGGASLAHGQDVFIVKPANVSSNTLEGGTDRAKRDAERLATSGAKMSTIRNLIGPADPVREAESDITTYDISSDVPGLNTYLLRSRYIDVGPNGVVPIHPHEGRPGILQIVEGEIYQHRSDRRSELMSTGNITLESQKLAHWWENSTDKPVRIWSVDLCNRTETTAGRCSLGLNEGSTVVGTGLHGQVANGPTTIVRTKTSINARIGLAEELPSVVNLQTTTLRSRTIVMEPKGVIPLHGHKGRPTFFRVMQGTITYHDAGEQRSFNKGQVILESGLAPHWWTNDGDETVVLHAIDLFDSASGS